MRKSFFKELDQAMYNNDRIYALTGDLGYGGFDYISTRFPDRYINAGASEQAMVDIAVGLAMSGKIPFVYSITSFLLYRPFESLRNYVNHELIPIKLIGSGRDRDYKHDGFSHWSSEARAVLANLPQIECYWPTHTDQIAKLMPIIINNKLPTFLSLIRT